MTLLMGHVIDPAGHPVKEAQVFLVSAPVSSPDIAQLSDDQGQFIISAPKPGIYVVGARSDSGDSAQAGVQVNGEETVTVILKLISSRD
jgi:hypothetical protein